MHNEIILLASEKLKENPHHTVYWIEHQTRRLWVKRRPLSKKKGWHTIQKGISQCLWWPILRPTVCLGGAKSLHEEAQRLALFKQKAIAVPEVIAVTDEFLITDDVGQTLHEYLVDCDNKQSILIEATKALGILHQQGLCHGRPSSRDIMVKNQGIFFIDLEEDPVRVMSLAEGQARDVWLFFNNMARYCEHTELLELYEVYEEKIHPETFQVLKQLIKLLKPLRKLAEYLPKPWVGRDVRSAIKANKLFEQII